MWTVFDSDRPCPPTRDQLAAMAMQGILASGIINMLDPLQHLARDAYAIADAMIAQRDKERA